ncbi:acyltransferase [Priestia megaterium]|uniref:acyltransferase n=1 Tax=Priestia megaterium TaxID=1404 RepID=UPI000BFE5AF5|nr:acyltransferase [Priestia megaterium]PGR00702.1 exopolysaccharide biosynthesis protein [Priestia megaterium]
MSRFDQLISLGNKIYRVSVILKKRKLKLYYGKQLQITPDLHFRKGFNILISKEGNLSIGKGCFFNFNCSISCLGSISIGDNSIFGENVKFYDHNHRFSDSTTLIKDQGYKVGSIKVGNNCWIGSNVTILNNVEIGDNVVIGANCVIQKSIPSNTIVRCNNELIMEERRNTVRDLAEVN